MCTVYFSVCVSIQLIHLALVEDEQDLKQAEAKSEYQSQIEAIAYKAKEKGPTSKQSQRTIATNRTRGLQQESKTSGVDCKSASHTECLRSVFRFHGLKNLVGQLRSNGAPTTPHHHSWFNG